MDFQQTSLVFKFGVKNPSLFSKYHQYLWGIFASVNNCFELFPAHSFANSNSNRLWLRCGEFGDHNMQD